MSRPRAESPGPVTAHDAYGVLASADDPEGNAKVVGCPGEEPSDIGVGPEPEGPPVEKTGGECLGHEQSAPVAGGQGRGIVEEGARVEDLEYLGVGAPATSRSRSGRAASRWESWPPLGA